MYHFDGDRVSAVFMGIALFEFEVGEFLTLTPQTQPWAQVAGHHGAALRSRVPALFYDVKAMILKGSPVNELISTKVKLDMLTGLGAGVMLIKDLEGTTLVSAEISYFGLPEQKFVTEPTSVEWPGIAIIKPANWHEGANRYMTPA